MPWLALDIAKKSFAAAVRRGEEIEVCSFPMTRAGWNQCRRWSQLSELQVCLESTGPYWKPLKRWLVADGIGYALANPRRVRALGKALQKLSKTDVIDAELILLYAECTDAELEGPVDPVYEQLQALSRRILQLQKALDKDRDQMEKSAADPAMPKRLLRSHRQLQRHLGQEIERLEAEIEALIQDHPQLRHQSRLLQTIPGIGPKTVRTLLAEYGPWLASASPKQLTSYAGLDIVLHESGSSVRRNPRISKNGNWRIRRALYLAALSAAHHNPRLKPFYRRKIDSGLARKQALVATARKLLHIVHGVLKNDTPFVAQAA